MVGVTSVKDTYVEDIKTHHKGKIVGLKYVKFGEYEEYKLCYAVIDNGILLHVPITNILNGLFKITE